MRMIIKLISILLIGLISVMECHADNRRLRMATTTSTDNTGLMNVLNPVFEEKYDINVDVIAVGTGKALRLARNGDVDLVLVHAPIAEQLLVQQGYGIDRHPVMHNDFVLLGSRLDPARVKLENSVTDAFKKISQKKTTFISRGDDSGTHKKELHIWNTAQVTPKGKWYLSVGQGMGAVLRLTNEKQAYTLSDRGTYIAYRDNITLSIAYEGDKLLHNPYHIILVNPAMHPHINIEFAKLYKNFLISEQGQDLIRNFRINGEILFHPDVTP